MPDLKQAALDYVRFVLKEEGETASSLARRIGLASTTLTRPLNDPDHKSQISTATLQKIMAETGYDFAPFISRDMNTLERTLDFFNTSDYERIDEKTHYVRLGEGTLIVGEVRIGHWLERRFFDTDQFWVLSLCHSRPEYRSRSIGLAVKDEACDLIAGPDDILFCVIRDAGSEEPRPGHAVIVERHLTGPNLYEISARMTRKLPDGTIAYTVHSSNRLLDGYVVEGATDTEIVRVIADIQYTVRSPSDAKIYEEEIGQSVRAERLRQRDELIKMWIDKSSL